MADEVQESIERHPAGRAAALAAARLPSALGTEASGQDPGDPVTMIMRILRHSDVIICRECNVMLNSPPAAREEAQKWMWDHVQKDHPDVVRGPVIFDANTFVPLGVTPPWEESSTTPDDPAVLDVPYEDADGSTAIPEESPTCP